MTRVIDIVSAHLVAGGFDGLVHTDAQCGCKAGDLAPCCGDFGQCEPAYCGADKSGDGEWSMYRSKEAADESLLAEAAAKASAALAQVAAPTLAPIQPPSDETATLNLGAICARLGFTVTAAFLLETLHIKPAATERGLPRFTEAQFTLICRQLVSHISAMAELHAGEPA